MATESREVQAIRQFMANSGVAHKVTATLGRYVSLGSPCYPHATGSYHCRPGTDGPGLAVDLAGPAPSRNSPQLLAIFATFGAVESRLAELIYSGAPYSIKNGKRVPRYAVEAHYDHVHISVPPGTFLAPPSPPKQVTPMFSPPLQIVAELDCPTGGVWLLAPDGAVYAFGGAPYLGGANGKDYFAGRTAARLELVYAGFGAAYRIVATSGEGYGPGF